jgi:hypothetical protein
VQQQNAQDARARKFPDGHDGDASDYDFSS